ncbi:MAG: ATP-binding protein, partial [Bacteroidales bacterium]|nr:ATP-binding protein [Bacteroidales bacterium]MBR5632137.1 ATP-binding protein [Bacteroidales bacterium]
ERIYIQSAFSIPSTEKRQNEERSLISVDDSFRKVIITADKVMKHRDEQGVLIMGLQEFLLNPEASL